MHAPKRTCLRSTLPFLLSLISFGAWAQGADDEFRKGIAARDRGDYEQAIRHLERAVEQGENDEHQLALGITLAWMERLDAAKSVYRDLLDRHPDSIHGRVELARVLLWQLRTDEARSIFQSVLSDAPDHRDALEGVMTAAWWQGDWRTAERYAHRVLSLDPERREASEIARGIEEASAPFVRVGTDFIDDDQPFQLARGETAYTIFSDPLTKWTFRAGSYLLDHPSRTELAPFAGVEGESRVPGIDLSIRGSLRMLEFPDGETELLGSIRAGLDRSIGTLSVSYERSELLRTSTAIDDHPSVDIIELRIARIPDDDWSASASVRRLGYFDENSGLGADLWILTPPFTRGRFSVSAGPALSYRDTEESRFFPGFPTGVYDPYWTPEQLWEIRAIIDATMSLSRIELRLHADGGWGEERISPEFLTRTFHPLSANMSATLRTGNRWTIAASIGHETTAFYEATSIGASLVRRF